MAEIPGSLETQTREPLDGKYWVQSFNDINTGLVFQGLLRFDRTTEKLWIKRNQGWVEITAGSSESSIIKIGEVTAGTTPSVKASTTGSNTVLDFVLPRGERGIAATIGIERIEVSPDGLGHIYNIGNENNAQFVIQLPDGPVGDKGDKGDRFTIDASGTLANRSNYDINSTLGFTYLINDSTSVNDGKIYVKVENGWQGPFNFKGDKGHGVYVAFADTVDGLRRSFSLDSEKKFISYINSSTQPPLSAFTSWTSLSITVVNDPNDINQQDLDQAISALQTQITTNSTNISGLNTSVTALGANKENTGVAATLDNNLKNSLLDGVPTAGNTLQKLYNLIQGAGGSYSVPTIAARNALDVKLHGQVLVDNDGDGKWALYIASTAGVNATYIKISDPDLLNAVLSNSQIKSAYESNADTNAFTNALLGKLNGIQANATANSSDALLRDRSTHTGTQATSTIVGLDSQLTTLTSNVNTNTTNISTNTANINTLLARGGIFRGVWAANTDYKQFDFVINPNGIIVYANNNVTSGATYISGNWSNLGVSVNDSSNTSTTQTWSANKIFQELLLKFGSDAFTTQTGNTLDFAFSLQERAPFTGNITIDTFLNVKLGAKVNLRMVSLANSYTTLATNATYVQFASTITFPSFPAALIAGSLVRVDGAPNIYLGTINGNHSFATGFNIGRNGNAVVERLTPDALLGPLVFESGSANTTTTANISTTSTGATNQSLIVKQYGFNFIQGASFEVEIQVVKMSPLTFSVRTIANTK